MKVRAHADYAYRSTYWTVVGQPAYSRVPGFGLVNARLTWRNSKEDLEFSASVTNLFDKYYYNSMFASVYSFSGTAYQQIGRPREWMLTVKKTF